MTIFHSVPTMLWGTAAVLLTVLGALSVKERILSFLGALCAAAAMLCSLVDGGDLSESLVYILILLVLSIAMPTARVKKEKRHEL